MKNERDEVLANYFDQVMHSVYVIQLHIVHTWQRSVTIQTYNDHCITKKELFDVLKKLENTKMELEVVREEKNTYASNTLTHNTHAQTHKRLCFASVYAHIKIKLLLLHSDHRK